MKSIIKNVEVEQKSEYPCLKLHSHSRVIVLFSNHKKGTIVYCNSEYYSIGESREDWLEDSFKPFIGTIELSN